MTLADSLTGFRGSVADANDLITHAFETDASSRYILPEKQRSQICNAAFLNLFIAWETFLESSFIGYMLGEPSILGRSITCYTQPKDEKHARLLLIGTQRYIDWANPDIMRKLCSLHFEFGGPHGTYINAIFDELNDLRTVRNAAAHLTSITGPLLDSVGNKVLKRPCANLSVSDFIFSTDPSSTSRETVLEIYQKKLDICAEGIANA